MCHVLSLILEVEGVSKDGEMWQETLQRENLEEREMIRRSIHFLQEIAPLPSTPEEAENWWANVMSIINKQLNWKLSKSSKQFFRNQSGWADSILAQEQPPALSIAQFMMPKDGNMRGFCSH